MTNDEDIKIRDMTSDLKDGQVKCPKCGSTDISTNTKTGKLRCNFCRHEFEPELAPEDEDISTLEGTTMGTGAADIYEAYEDMVTVKCESCGAEVVIDTKTNTQARCHWCRNTLSINNIIPNGAVPDVILPFKVTKTDAQEEIAKFVNKRKFFAHPTFRREFTTENISGVYLPYMLVDVNAHMNLCGEGQIETDRRKVKDGDDSYTVYDANSYDVERDFDIVIDDLSIEASSDKLDYNAKDKTTNVINAIMPFDTENCVKFNANYMKGYTSEKRDSNIEALRDTVEAESADVARIAAKETIKKYDRGVRWETEDYTVKGDSWKAAYLPVWLYSYMQKKNGKNLLHYVAVNARTKETMGSVPINFKKLFIYSVLVEIFGGLAAFFLRLLAAMSMFDGTEFQDSRNYFWILLVSGFVFYFTIYVRYRNLDERHHYENETKHEISNLLCEDIFLKKLTDLKDDKIKGENSSELKGNKLDLKKNKDLKKVIDKGLLDEVEENKKKLNDLIDERDK
ncbi:hypothetical protein HMPREF1634_06365 [Tissierellia bacterium S7-1-4]|nr:hypothetical protein HMPREF1634_06365 [Tissierellia bacterium S7-1-4]